MRRKNAPAEVIGVGRPQFWTVDPDPVEWSPITNAKVNLIPLTADAYLYNKAQNKAVAQVLDAEPAAHVSMSAQKEIEHDEERAPSALAVHLRRLLPVVVVILLLLGLLGALLSSFYFPGDKPGAYLLPTHRSVQSTRSIMSGEMASGRAFRITTLDLQP